MTLPLAGGDVMTLTGTFTARGIGPVALTLGNLGDIEFSALVQFRPHPDHLDENCVLKPLNHFIATAQMLMR